MSRDARWFVDRTLRRRLPTALPWLTIIDDVIVRAGYGLHDTLHVHVTMVTAERLTYRIHDFLFITFLSLRLCTVLKLFKDGTQEKRWG